MAIIKVVQTILECLRCGHKWTPRGKKNDRASTVEVRICPHCKSPYWDRPRTN